jgi:hypothetical protein
MKMPVEILVVRPATTDEIEFCRWGERDARPRRIDAPRLSGFATTQHVRHVGQSSGGRPIHYFLPASLLCGFFKSFLGFLFFLSFF